MSRLEELIRQLCPDGVEYKLLSELFNTKNGYTPSKSNPEFWTNGTIPWFRMEDIKENGRILSKATQYVSKDAIKDTPFPENSIIVATSATIGEHALITVPSLANQRFTYLMLKDQFKDKFDIKFLYYYCFTPDLRLHLCKAADLKAVLDRIPEMMLVYDSGNTLLVREDPAWHARQFAGRIGHVHLKDMKPAGPGDRGADVDLYGNRMACAPIGTGTVDFDAVLTALENGGYHGLLTVEFIVGPDKDYPKSLRGSRLYAEQLLAKTRDTASRHGG